MQTVLGVPGWLYIHTPYFQFEGQYFRRGPWLPAGAGAELTTGMELKTQ